MATVRWVGGATATAQVDALTVGGTIETDDIFKITLTGENGDTHTLSVTAGSTNADTVASNIAAAFNAETHYLFTGITAAAVGSGGQLTLTADTAGVPFYCTVETTEAGGGAADAQTFTRSATTVNSGPYDWNTAENWDTGSIPADADTVYVEGATILYGLDQSGSFGALESLAALHINQSQVGSNPGTGRSAAYLVIPADEVHINEYVGPGSVVQSGPVMVDTSNTASTIVVYGGSSNTTSTLPSVWLLANADTTVIDIRGGIVGIAYDSGSSSLIKTLRVSGGSVYTGDGFSCYGSGNGAIEISGGVADLGLANDVQDIDILGGTVKIRENANDFHDLRMDGGTLELRMGDDGTGGVTVYGGTLTWIGSSTTGGINSFDIYDGMFIYGGDQDITTLKIYGGIVDCTATHDQYGGRTVTTCYLEPGGTLIADFSQITITSAIAPYIDNRVKYVAVSP